MQCITLCSLRNTSKTWSNLELALRLKKDVIKALILHTPAILGNKFSYPRSPKATAATSEGAGVFVADVPPDGLVVS